MQSQKKGFRSAMSNMRSADHMRFTRQFSATQINFENIHIIRSTSVLKSVFENARAAKVHIRTTTVFDDRRTLSVVVLLILII